MKEMAHLELPSVVANVKHHGKSAFAQLAHMKKLQRLCAMDFC